MYLSFYYLPSKTMWEENLKRFDKAVAEAGLERKGKGMPYTSANGHMFSLLNKDGEIGIRLSKEEGQAFMEQYESGQFRSHGANMRGYVLVPKDRYDDSAFIGGMLKQALAYVMTLEPK